MLAPSGRAVRLRVGSEEVAQRLLVNVLVGDAQDANPPFPQPREFFPGRPLPVPLPGAQDAEEDDDAAAPGRGTAGRAAPGRVRSAWRGAPWTTGAFVDTP
jgi:hypothetical protein